MLSIHHDIQWVVALRRTSIDLIAIDSVSTLITDENRAGSVLQRAYEKLFQRLLVVKKELGNKIEAINNMCIKLTTVNQQINELLLSSVEHVRRTFC